MNKTMHLQEEAARCLLRADAPCSKACKKGDPARAIRAIRFDNEAVAGLWLDPCSDTIVYPTFDREQCIGCGRCYTSCQDGGHQAITFDADLRQPHLDGKRCVGCHLCRLVCPTGAIGVARRIAKTK